MISKVTNIVKRLFKSASNEVDSLKDTQFKAIGKNVQINNLDSIHAKSCIEIGNNVYIGGDAYIWGRGGLVIEDNTIIGPRVTIHTVNHRYENATMLPYDNYSYLKPVIIGKNVWIGDHTLICPGTKIGDGAVIAMGSVVSGEIPRLAVVAGNPAKVIKYRDAEMYDDLVKKEKYYLQEKSKQKMKSTYIS